MADWATLSAKLAGPELFLREYSEYIGAPFFCDSEDEDRGYRYSRPDIRHFCLLKSAKAIVSWKAALVVAAAGFHTEVISLLRISVECSTFVNWVSSSTLATATERHKKRVNKITSDYFADYVRSEAELPSQIRVTQSEIHEMYGEILAAQPNLPVDFSNRNAKQLLDSVYIRYSKYVHAGYPETIDLFGAPIGMLNLDGSSGSFKDEESFACLETQLDSILHAIAGIALFMDRSCLTSISNQAENWLRRYRS